MHFRISGQRSPPSLAFGEGLNGHFDRLGQAIAKGDAQGQRQAPRKAVGPEDRRRLAHKHAPAQQGELPQWMPGLEIHGVMTRSGKSTKLQHPTSREASSSKL